MSDFTTRLKPLSMVGLLLTVLLLFGFQAQTIVSRPLLIVLIAAPIIIQSYSIFFIAYGAAKAWKVPVMLSLVAIANRTRGSFTPR